MPSKPTLIQRLKNGFASLSFYEWLTLAISVISTTSLAFIWYQVKQTSASLQASAYATIGNYTMDLDKIFLEHPELRPYFYEGQPITKDDKNYHTVMAIAEFQLDFFDATMTQLEIRPRESGVEMAEEKKTWDNYFADSFKNSPALCQRFRELSLKGWYRQNLEDIGQRQCGERK